MNVKDGSSRQGSTREEERIERPRDSGTDEKWVRDDKPERAKASAKAGKPKGAGADGPRFVLPDDAVSEIQKRAGKRADRLLRYLKDAGAAYASERWGDARKSLRPLLQEVPDAPIVQELYGMVLYRTGKWAAAVKELQASHLATHAFDLYPAMMDCHRALGQFEQSDVLWEELRLASPDADTIAEGRIVMAGTLADRERLADGIRLLEKAPRTKNEPREHHLRTWYALADLYDRAGESSRARMLFEKVAKHDPQLGDVLGRLDGLK